MVENQSKQTPKQHLKEIIILISIPAIIILLIVGLFCIPNLLANPSSDFIYCQGYDCETSFVVDSNGKITLRSAEADDQKSTLYSRYPSRQLFYYDAKKDSAKPIELDEALKYQLDPASKSPDGYTLSYSDGPSFGLLLFYENRNDGWLVKKGLISKPLSIKTYNINFIGWVK